MKSALTQTAFQSIESAKTPQSWQAGGVFNTASDNSNNTSIGKNIVAEHYCYCRPGFACDLCLEWHRIKDAPHILPLPMSLWRPAVSQVGRV